MNYKEETQRTYNQYAEEFEKKFAKQFEKRVKKEAGIFLNFLEGKNIVDLGSGPGIHAAYFQEKCLNVLAVDSSKSMIRLCRKKNLKTKVMDMEQWNLPTNTFDGVWAYASVLHLPKTKLKNVVENIRKTLKLKGVLGIAVKEGEGERFEEIPENPTAKRWFTYFTDEEFKDFFKKDFEIMHASRAEIIGSTFLYYIFRKK